MPLAARIVVRLIRAVPRTVAVTGTGLSVVLLASGRSDAAAAAAVAALLALSVTVRVWLAGRS